MKKEVLNRDGRLLPRDDASKPWRGWQKRIESKEIKISGFYRIREIVYCMEYARDSREERLFDSGKKSNVHSCDVLSTDGEV